MSKDLTDNKRHISIGLILLSIGLIASAVLADRFNNQRFIESSRASTAKSLMNIHDRLEISMRKDLQLINGLVSLVSTPPSLNQREFARAAKALFISGSNLRNIGAAPDMVIRLMYPIKGNEQAIGLDYRKTPGQIEMAEKARDNREMVLAGPLQLVQGGTGLIGRFPVFVESGTDEHKFWGLISAVIDVDKLYRSAGLLDPDIPLNIAIQKTDDQQHEVFFGNPAIFDEQPETIEVVVPGGNWRIAAVPQNGWPAIADNAVGFRTVLALILLLIIVPVYLLNRTAMQLTRTEALLREEKNRFHHTLENTPNVAIQWYDRSGRVLYWNRASQSIFGWSSEEAIGKTLDQLIFSAEQQRDFTGHLANIPSTDTPPLIFESEITHKNGSTKQIYSSLFSIQSESGPMFVCMDIDITERKRTELELIKSREQFEHLVNDIGDNFVVYSHAPETGEMLYVSDGISNVFALNKEDVLGKPWAKVVNWQPHSIRQGREVIARLMSFDTDFIQHEMEFTRPDGSPCIINVSSHAALDEHGNVISIDGIVEDVTERKSNEKQLRQTQKTEAVGTLIGGIAHEFNNMLAAITGNLHLARNAQHKGINGSGYLIRAEETCFRAAAMIKQLLIFARKDFTSKSVMPINLVHWLPEAMELIERNLGPNIRVTYVIDDESDLTIDADPVELQQLVTHLVMNARDACLNRREPAIEVSLQGGIADAVFRLHHKHFDADAYVKLVVSDNGIGIPESELERIFEPFFTTKETGKGSGLGLSVTQGIVQSMHGIIEVSSQVATGTSFTLYLPRISKRLPAPRAGSEPRETISGQGETILIADDESNLLTIFSELLRDLGYQVIQANNGAEAVERFAATEGIDLVILDILMPVMGGIEAAMQIRERDADVPLLFLTGFNPDQMNDQLSGLNHYGLIAKPIDVAELSDVIRQTLALPA